MAEVLMLAARSLATISNRTRWMFRISASSPAYWLANRSARRIWRGCFAVLGEKNAHGLSALASELGLSPKTEQLLSP
jgi:hypothetical protein